MASQIYLGNEESEIVARFALRFREEGVREALERAALDIEKWYGDRMQTEDNQQARFCGWLDAATYLRRLAEPREVEGDGDA